MPSEPEHAQPVRLGYLFPVQVLARLFRGKFLHGLRALHAAGGLDLDGSCQSLSQPQAFQAFLDTMYRKRWVVYSKAPFGGADAVYAYLGRYTHRVGISNARLLHVDATCVRFRTRHQRHVTLSPVQFIRRLMLHVLPKGFVRIRHFGLLAPVNVPTRLALSRSFLTTPRSQAPTPSETPPPALIDSGVPAFVVHYHRLTGVDLRRCPACGEIKVAFVPLGSLSRGPP